LVALACLALLALALAAQAPPAARAADNVYWTNNGDSDWVTVSPAC
jgi:hypothetical protein